MTFVREMLDSLRRVFAVARHFPFWVLLGCLATCVGCVAVVVTTGPGWGIVLWLVVCEVLAARLAALAWEDLGRRMERAR